MHGSKERNHHSIVTVIKEYNGLVDGVWVQHCMATTLEEATERARSTEKANSNRITVAVVEYLPFSCPNYCLMRGLKRLDNGGFALINGDTD